MLKKLSDERHDENKNSRDGMTERLVRLIMLKKLSDERHDENKNLVMV